MKKNYDNQQIINIILDFIRKQYNIMEFPYTVEEIIYNIADNYKEFDYNNKFYFIKYTKKVLKYLIHMNYVKDNNYYYTTKTKIKKGLVITPEDVNNYFESLKNNFAKTT